MLCQEELGFKFALGVTRTLDPRIRNPLLYPAELRELIIEFTINRCKPATEEKKSFDWNP